jgi:hypothetical protein
MDNMIGRGLEHLMSELTLHPDSIGDESKKKYG